MSESRLMSYATDDVKNWMHMFRWIVKLIRDDYAVDEAILTRSAGLAADCGLTGEQLENLLDTISRCFELRFPMDTLDEVVKLEQLCMLAAWMRGLYRRPDGISDEFEDRCRAVNALCE